MLTNTWEEVGPEIHSVVENITVNICVTELHVNVTEILVQILHSNNTSLLSFADMNYIPLFYENNQSNSMRK